MALLEISARVDLSDAACVTHRNPDLWHSDSPSEQSEAKRICRGCPALTRCDEYAMQVSSGYDAAGVWAGVGAQNRRFRRTAMKRAAAVPDIRNEPADAQAEQVA